MVCGMKEENDHILYRVRECLSDHKLEFLDMPTKHGFSIITGRPSVVLSNALLHSYGFFPIKISPCDGSICIKYECKRKKLLLCWWNRYNPCV